MKLSVLSLFITIFLFGACVSLNAQSALTPALQKNRDYSGAVAKQKKYHAVYQIDVNDPEVISKTLRNIKNALHDPRLEGKLTIELVAFSGGVATYMKSSPYEKALKDLIQEGVLVVQCANTLKEKNIKRSEIFDFVGIVPSGNGELIIRQAEGWSIVKP